MKIKWDFFKSGNLKEKFYYSRLPGQFLRGGGVCEFLSEMKKNADESPGLGTWEPG